MINTNKLSEVGKLLVCVYGNSIDVEELAVLKKNENEQALHVNTQSIANMILITAAMIASTQNAQIA